MLLYKQKKNQVAKGKRFLISVTVLGSAGPIRFVVNEEELVAAVIDTALKSYAREGRLPILGSDLNDFLLYCRHAASDVPGRVFLTEGLVHIQRYVSDSKVLREREAECSFARNRQMLNYFDSMGSYGPNMMYEQVWRKDVMVIKNRPKVSLSNKLKSRFTTKKWE
ncbi:hypothetical protein D5086_016584 [Populus alba]|uniref:Uncharacterized protein n=1 Tax=Populus alba TaxID=43335 RepID=A0ACC4BUK8_POPAL